MTRRHAHNRKARNTIEAPKIVAPAHHLRDILVRQLTGTVALAKPDR